MGTPDVLLLVPTFTMLSTVVLLPLLIRGAPLLGLVAQPAPRKMHAVPIPEVGGIALCASVLVACALWHVLGDQGSGAAGVAHAAGASAVLIVTVLGAVDDRVDLHYGIRVVVQFAAAALVAATGLAVITDTGLPFLPALPFALALPLTMVVIVGVANAVNFTDGLDGLAGGCMLLIGGALAWLAHAAGERDLLLVTLAVLGALVGFLRFNTHPARVFMGDSGAYFLGFTLAILAIRLGQGVYAPALVLLLFGLPVFDLLMVTITRLVRGRSPFQGGRDHTHHALLALGLQHYQAVVVTYLVCAAFVGAAFLLRDAGTLAICATFVAMALGLVAAHRLALGFVGARVAGARAPGQPDLLGRWLANGSTEGREGVRRFRALAVVTVILPCHVAWTLAGSGDAVVHALSATAAALALALVLRLLPAAWRVPCARFALYVAAAALVYISHRSGLVATGADLVLLVLLAASVLLALGLARGSFPLTPMDALLALLLLLPALPGSDVDAAVMRSCAKSLVLFYAVELVLNQRRFLLDALRRWRPPGVVANAPGAPASPPLPASPPTSPMENRHA
jgi:UDP-GlcNAc:undecaprenyl-phosphate GlcNAc-1-phosphate transferase